MPVTLSSPQPRRWRSRSSGEPSIRSQPSINLAASENRPTQTARKQRRSRLDNPYWRPYRNSEDLAQQVYALTHPDGVKTFGELAREADLARELRPYQEAVVRLSELLK